MMMIRKTVYYDGCQLKLQLLVVIDEFRSIEKSKFAIEFLIRVRRGCASLGLGIISQRWSCPGGDCQFNLVSRQRAMWMINFDIRC